MTGRSAETALRAALAITGVGALGFGAVLLLGRGFGELVSVALWFTLPAVLSDLVLLPAVAGVGWLLTKRLSPGARLPAQVALVMIGALTAVAAPFLGTPGLRVDNPTLLNRNYLAGYAVFVAVILVAAALWAVLRTRARRVP
ncbi:MAG: hypothetical protein ABJA16_10575 [Nakamurella sp.]